MGRQRPDRQHPAAGGLRIEHLLVPEDTRIVVALNPSSSTARRAVALLALTATLGSAAMITNPGRAWAVLRHRLTGRLPR